MAPPSRPGISTLPTNADNLREQELNHLKSLNRWNQRRRARESFNWFDIDLTPFSLKPTPAAVKLAVSLIVHPTRQWKISLTSSFCSPSPVEAVVFERKSFFR